MREGKGSESRSGILGCCEARYLKIFIVSWDGIDSLKYSA